MNALPAEPTKPQVVDIDQRQDELGPRGLRRERVVAVSARVMAQNSSKSEGLVPRRPVGGEVGVG